MRATRLFFWIIITLFLFQNCEVNQDAPTESALTAQEALPPVQELEALNLEKPIVLYVEEQTLVIHLESGTIVGAEDQDQLNSCLSEVKLDEFKTLLSEAKLCKLNNEISEDTVCAMVYTYPYAGIYVGNELAMRLVGERKSACPKTTVEFCENNEEIETYVDELDFTQDFAPCQGEFENIPELKIAPVSPIDKDKSIFTY